MPLIIYEYLEDSRLAFLGRGRELVADLEIKSQQIRAKLTRGRTLTAIAAGSIPVAALLDRGRDIEAFLRLNDEANILLAASLDRGREIVVGESHLSAIIAILTRDASLTAGPRQSNPDLSVLTLVLMIAPPDTGNGLGNPGFSANYGALIELEGSAETYPIKAYEFTEGRDTVGSSLNLTLVNPDRARIETSDRFKFQIYADNAYHIIFDSGHRAGAAFSFAFRSGGPADTLSISSNAPIAKMLARSPLENTTVYDPDRIALKVADFAPFFDNTGERFDQELVQKPGLTIKKLMDLTFKEYCGFSDFETSIPDFPVKRADFQITSTFLQGIAGHIGLFDPFIHVDAGKLWVLDGTARFPAGFGTPGELKSDAYQSCNLTDIESDLDGYLIQYSDTEANFDYFSTRTENDDPEPNGDSGAGNYHEIIRRRTYRDYYKEANPLVPVKTEKVKDITEIYTFINGSFGLQSTNTETVSLDSQARIKKISRELVGVAPNLTGSAYANANLKTIEIFYKYAPDLFNPRREFLTEKKEEVSGYIAIDTETLNLGKPFKQDFVEAFGAGNLKSGLTLSYGAISTKTERTTQTPKGQYEMRTDEINFLTDPPRVTGTTTDARAGDASMGPASATVERLVMKPGRIRTNESKIETLPVLELPFALAEALAVRKLQKTRLRRGTITLLGIKPNLRRGAMFELFDRDDLSVGFFVVEGRSITADGLGTREQRSRQILEIKEI